MIVNEENVNVQNIRLIIWDLDNTFWDGIISEEKIKPKQRLLDFVKQATDRGIVNSICSKNNLEECKKQLIELNIWDYFVFPSIEWQLKGQRLFGIIKDMGLRPANTLFIDDEALNLQNALSIDPTLLCAFPNEELFTQMEKQLSNRKLDKKHEKLLQYKNLEKKHIEKQKYADDTDFLRNANIQIAINSNCMEVSDRIFELINKTNQLNFTKVRLTQEQTEQLLLNPDYECKYITCKDKFGAYGIIGFYALNKRNNSLEHYLFSCRTIGMGIEGFVFNLLKKPSLIEIEPITIHIGDNPINPDWITLVDEIELAEDSQKKPKTIFKGPCDLSQVVPFLSEKTDEEFTYMSDVTHRMIEAQNHTVSILQSQDLKESVKEELVKTLEIIDKDYFSTALFEKEYDVFVYSLLVDYGLGLYENKNNPEIVIPFGQYTVDITDEKNWESLMQNGYRAENPLSLAFLQYFRDNYKFIGRISAKQLINNLLRIKEKLPERTIMILVNGSEIAYGGNVSHVLKDREKIHIEMNKEIRDFVAHSSNCYLIEISELVKTSDNYLDTINHYKKIVYYNLAKEINKVISSAGFADLGEADQSVLRESILQQHYGQVRKAIKGIVAKLFGYRSVAILRKVLRKVEREK